MGRAQRRNANKKKTEDPEDRIKELKKEIAQGNANIERLQKEINRLTFSVAMRQGAIEELQRNQKTKGDNHKEE